MKLGNERISFEDISKRDVLELIKELPRSKATISKIIPVSVSLRLTKN